ncbi:MAG TPA: phosphotransferase [Gaiellaceae bacterium]|nr:phosphotransferase [Gaiellaceae bacterium]
MTVAAVELAVSADTAVDAGESLWELLERTGLAPIVVGVSKDANAKVTLILVSPESGRPELVVKAPTTATAARAVERETRMLRAIRPGLPERLRATVPCPLQAVELDGERALVTTALAGSPMPTSYLRRGHTRDRSRVAGDLERAGAWLAELQDATAGEHAPVDVVHGVGDRLRERFADDARLGEVLDRLAEAGARLERATTPSTVVHGDFWFGNVLVTDGAVSGVVDWEFGEPVGEPLRDVVRFALSYALYLDRRTRPGRRVAGHPGLRAGSFGAAVEFAVAGEGWFPEQFRAFLRGGLRRLGASPDLWPELVLAGIAEIAARSDDDAFAAGHLDLFCRIGGLLGRESR